MFAAADGSLLVYGQIERDPDPNTGLDINDLLVAKLDASGNVLFRSDIAETRNDSTGAAQFNGSIAGDAQGVVYLTGWLEGELVMGAEAGGEDAFLRRLDANGNPR